MNNTKISSMLFKAISFSIAVLFSAHLFSLAQSTASSGFPTDVPADAQAKLREIYEGNAYAVKSFRATWLPDASGYLSVEETPGKDEQILASYDVESGARTVLISSHKLILPVEEGQTTIENYTLSPDGGKVLLQGRNIVNDSRDYWVLERRTGIIIKVKAGRNSSISPEGQRILFTEDGNLYVYDLRDSTTIQITNSANSGMIYDSRATWSPDGNRIAFVRSDASDVRRRNSLVPGDPSYPEVKETGFARVGGTITSLRVGVVDARGQHTSWLSFPIPAEGYYLGQMSWAGNSSELLVEKLSRFRDKRQFILADINSGEYSVLYEESDPAWVVASYRKNIGLEWFNDHKDYLILSEKDGWRHAYVFSRKGKEQKLLTSGEFDIIERVMVDGHAGWLYYNASPENGTQKYLYRVRLDGRGKAERITPVNQTGTHNYRIAPNGRWAFHTYSSANTPPVTELVTLPDHKTVRMLEDNKALREKMATLDIQDKEYIQLNINGGYTLDAWMIKPRDFDSSRKYPVFVYVYGEPHGQTVIDAWGHAMADYHRVIADLGYVVVSIDNRGTPCPKGAAWRRAVAGSLGPLSTEEQAAALLELGKTMPFVDLTRVGIWGWSGGGSNTLNAMFRKPDLYDVGIAVAPKPQPHLYNAWFQEIYMNNREVNPEGYQRSAPINFAEGLKGDLLIVHGSGETNTHIQITEGLVDRLIELGKQFDYIVYPNRDHGIRKGKGTSLHLRIHMARYLLRHLPPGPK